MASYNIQWEPRAIKELRAIDRIQAIKILKVVTKLRDDPSLGQALQGRFKQFRRLRVGDYRVIYHLRQKELIIIILRVAKRPDAYRPFT